MHIKSSEHLQQWLISELTPISAADPMPLSRYVDALLKKDMKTEKLRAFCVDQLDVFLGKDTRAFVDRLFDVVTSDKYMPEREEKERKIDEKTRETASSRKEKLLRSSRHENKSPRGSRHDERTSRNSRYEDKSPRGSRREERVSRNSRHEEKALKNLRYENRLSRSSRHEDRPSRSSRHDKSTRSEERSPKKGHRHEERSSEKKDEDKSSVLPPGVDSVVDSFDGESKKRRNDGAVETSTRVRDEGEEATMKSAKLKRPRITPPEFNTRTGTSIVHENVERICSLTPPTMIMPQPAYTGVFIASSFTDTMSMAHVMPPGVDAYNTGVFCSYYLESSDVHAGIMPQVHEGYRGAIAASTLQTFAQPAYGGGALVHLNCHTKALIADVISAPQDMIPPGSIPQFSQGISDTLILTHIPKEKLTMAILEEFFSRYGTVRAVALRYNNRDDCALISFVDATATEAVMKSPQAILDNRFIRVSVFDPGRADRVSSATSMPKQERRTIQAKNQTIEDAAAKRDEEMRRLKERMRELQDEIDHVHAEINDAQRSKPTVPCDRGSTPRSLSMRHVPPSVAPLDKRPRTLLVSGFSADDKDEIIMHLRDFGTIDKLELDSEADAQCVRATYSTRREAEMARRMIISLNGPELRVDWEVSKMSVDQQLQSPDDDEDNINNNRLEEYIPARGMNYVPSTYCIEDDSDTDLRA